MPRNPQDYYVYSNNIGQKSSKESFYDTANILDSANGEKSLGNDQRL